MKKTKHKTKEKKSTSSKKHTKPVKSQKDIKKLVVKTVPVKKASTETKEKRKIKALLGLYTLVAIIAGSIVLFITKSWVQSAITTLGFLAFLILYMFLRIKLKEAAKIKKMEAVFPDFLSLMSSNLRAGMTIDRALLLSSRKEFAPLDKEILTLGKRIVTGKKIEEALEEMSQRIKSEKISKTNTLIISGIKSGGNLAVLLEKTASNLRERDFVEKKSASNVLMYMIFIFFAVAVGAPALFGLSTVLVEVLTNLLEAIPPLDTTASRLPFTLTQINISVTFITYYALIFLIITDILGSLVLGLVRRGEEKAGAKFIIPLLVLSVGIFFLIKIVLSNYFAGVIG